MKDGDCECSAGLKNHQDNLIYERGYDDGKEGGYAKCKKEYDARIDESLAKLDEMMYKIGQMPPDIITGMTLHLLTVIRQSFGGLKDEKK